MTSDSRHVAASSPWVAAALALALALALAAMVGCSSKHLTPEQQAQAEAEAYQAQIRKVVTDPARADQLVALIGELQQQIRESVANLRDYQAKVAALDTNYEATREDYEVLIGQRNAHHEAFLKKFAGLRAQMTALTTDAEWEQLKKARLRTLEADLRDLVSVS